MLVRFMYSNACPTLPGPRSNKLTASCVCLIPMEKAGQRRGLLSYRQQHRPLEGKIELKMEAF
jgi:hypothetical protein